MRKTSLLAAITTGLAFANPANAYEIGSESVAKSSLDLHETMTRLAIECLERTGTSQIDCSPELERLDEAQERKASASLALDYSVRWPDDPTRMLDRDSSKLAIGGLLFKECGAQIGDDTRIDETGLLCSSHYGRLSFMHAMAVPQTEANTRDLSLQWAAFAFRAATSEEFRSMNYCQAIDSLEDQTFADQLRFSDDSRCREKQRRFLFFKLNSIPAWKVSTLFNFDCRKPFWNYKCSERIADYGDKTTIAAATGALLHLVQDSFSQSHVDRAHSVPIPDGEQYGAVISCAPGETFFDYTDQESELHANADKIPAIDENCSSDSQTTDDPITASATVLRFVDRCNDEADAHCDPEGFSRYLRERVFPSS